jgi:uncharacterized protein involved in exopolysaccharide biosynthesis
MRDEQEIELIDYLIVIWKRKGLIIGGTLISVLTALVVDLSMPKLYKVSRTLKIGRLPIRVTQNVYVIDRGGRVIPPPTSWDMRIERPSLVV